MNSFAELTAKLNLNIQGFSKSLGEAAGQLDKFAKDARGKINKDVVDPAKSVDKAFKSVGRVVSGILISQAFYTALRSIKDTTSAVWEFTQSLEYAEIAYTNLFRNQQLASEFLNVLKDAAATTPFAFKDVEESARRLLAYGIEAKNIMYVMKGVMAAGTLTGDARQMETIARSLGQIYTQGRLYNRELRQLTRAGIPAYEILQEKLGLTEDQLRNLSTTAIDASTAINALVDGMTERFGAGAEAANMTVRGLFANLKDNLLQVGAEIIQPFYQRVRAGLIPIVETVNELRQVVSTKGIGGLFERLFPPEMHEALRTFVANIQVAWQNLKIVFGNIGQVIKIIINAIIQAANIILPIMNAVSNVSHRISQAILQNEKAVRFLTNALAVAAAMWVIFKIQALASAAIAGVIGVISKAVGGLGKMLTWIVAHPFWTLLMVLGGLVVGLSGGFNKLGDSIRGVFKSLTSFSGIDPDKVLMPSQKERAAELEKFNQALDGTSKGMDELADSTGKATKAAKGLLGFDEVFKLNQLDPAGTGGAFDYGDLDFGGIGDLDWEPFIPEMPDFSSFGKDFTDGLINALGGQQEAIGLGIGAILGAAIGAIIGGPAGAKIGLAIGALAGWIAGHFWDDIVGAFESVGLHKYTALGAAILGPLAAAIGFKVGGPAGAAVGAAIGLLVSWLIGEIATGIETGDWSGIAPPLGIGLGAAIGMVAGGPAGAALGAAIGGLVGWLGKLFTEGFTTGEWEPQKIGGGLGTGIGAGIGAIIGGPPGAAIGAAIGALVGWIGGLIADNWEVIKDWFTDTLGPWFEQAFIDIGEWFKGAWKDVSGFFTDIWDGLTEWLGDLWGSISDFFTEAWEGVSGFFSDIWKSVSDFFTDIWDGLGEWLGNIWTDISTWFSDLWADLSSWASDLFEPLTDAFSDLYETVGGILGDIWEALTTVWEDIKSGVSTVATSIWETISEIALLIWDIVVDSISDIWEKVSTFFTDLWESLSGWFSDIWGSLTEWFGEYWAYISGWISEVWEEVVTQLSDLWESISTWFSDLWTGLTEWLSEYWSTMSSWFSDLWTDLTGWLGDIWTSISDFFTDIWNGLVESLSNVWEKISGFFSDVWEGLTGWIGDSWESLVGFFGDITGGFSGTLSDVWEGIKESTSNIYNTFTGWISNLWDNVFGKFFGWISDGIDKIREFLGLEKRAKATDTSSYVDTTPVSGSTGALAGRMAGHAAGGIFNKEHLAWFAEGNKAEAIIPLENESAMMPFVDSISNRLLQTLGPMVASMSGGSSEELRPLYVGTLIADERGLRELQKKMYIIEMQEATRRGI